VSEVLHRSHEELAAAELLAKEGFTAQAVSRAYYAAFYAAEAALAALGESRSRHAAVVAAFGALIVKSEGVDPRVGRALHSLFEMRVDADYDQDPVPEDEARAALDAARLCVNAVEAWLAARGRDDEG
jgi:uncharacterized protein (UPF0332 family)